MFWISSKREIISIRICFEQWLFDLSFQNLGNKSKQKTPKKPKKQKKTKKTNININFYIGFVY